MNLNKRLLVLEIDESLETLDIIAWNNQPLKKICEGPDLTEEIAEKLVEILWKGFKNYSESDPVGNYNRLITTTALESFISAIESQGYYWGENPLRKPEYTIDWYGKSASEFKRYETDMQKWQEAESRTFNPEKTLIFKIV